MTGIFWAAACFAFAPLFVSGVRRVARLPLKCPWFYFQWTCAALGGFVSALLSGEWTHVAGWGASALLALVLWWWSRRKRKRSLKALGHKARARLAAMVKNMPRPSPRLVPQRMPV